LTALLFALIAAPISMANQGGYYTNTDGGVTHVADASRAHIKGTGSEPSTGGAIATVRVQSGDSTGLYQFGEINEGSNFSTDCGKAVIGLMAERIHQGGTGQICDTYFGGWGADEQFAVKRASDGSGWSAYLNGTVEEGPYQLGFPDSGVAFAVAEYNGTAPISYDFTWGPGTEQPWQWTYGSDLVYHTVQPADGHKFNDGGWSITSLPSPFSISR
jgi:hypothetical protein